MTQPQFLRRYELVVGSSPASSAPRTLNVTSDDEPHAVRLTFDVQTATFFPMWTAQISVYNPSEEVTEFLTQGVGPTVPIKQGMPVKLSAGYQGAGANYGVIWDGYVLQVLWEREHQTDFKITLNCVLGLDPAGLNNNPTIWSTDVAVNQATILQQMAKNAFHPIDVGAITDQLKATQLPRGYGVFGSPQKYLSEITRDNDAQWWIGQKGLMHVGKVQFTAGEPTITYTPTTGLIGTPRQVQNGVNFRVLMNPAVSAQLPPVVVKLDQTQIVQELKRVNVLPGILSSSGVYVVVGVRYFGDTRGQEWYTDVTGVLTAKELAAAGGVLPSGYVFSGAY